MEAPGGIASVNIDQELSSSYHVELIAELFPVDYLILWKLYKLKLVDIYLTQSMLDARKITIIELNTNTFKEIAPAMYERWPDTEVQIELNATDTPSLSQSSGSLVLTFDASWSFQVCLNVSPFEATFVNLSQSHFNIIRYATRRLDYRLHLLLLQQIYSRSHQK